MTLFPSFFVNKTGGYEIEQSLRFDGTNTLTKTFTGTARTTLTVSGWVKFGKNHNYAANLLFYGTGGSGNTQAFLSYGANNGFWVSQLDFTGGSYENATHLDFSAWLHVVYSRNGTSSHTLYINGVESPMTNGGTGSLPNSWLTGPGVINNPNGYLAELHVVDGSNLNQYDFGEFDDNGVWRPIEYTGSHGTNGFYLTFDPSATNGIGHDHSGNGNHWTAAAGFVTSGTGTDVMSDTPTTNWCTLNPIGSSSTGGFSEGNLNYYNGTTSTWRSGVSTFAVSSGKWYFEAKFTSFPASSAAFVGIGPDTIQWVNNVSHFGQGSASGSYGYYSNNGNLYSEGSGSSYGATYTTNDVIGVALDLDAGTLRFYKNGTDQGEAVSGLTGTWNVGVSSLDTPAVVNFGQRDFEQTVPTGFNPLNTANLPAPDIADGSQNMMPVLWTGTGSARTQGGYNFQPDLLWIMRRDASGMSVRLHDVVRGDNGTVMYRLGTNHSNNEDADTDVTGLTSTGFTIGNDGSDHPNILNATYVGWGWREGASQGFDIVSYTGNGVNGRGISHSLGVTPAFIIVKNRDSAEAWAIWHQGLDSAIKYLTFTSAAAGSASAIFGGGANEQLPDSSNFYIGSNGMVNANGDDYIAYCFAEVEGYSKFGTYTGNASTDGPFVYCGFKPAVLIVKATTSGSAWGILDSTRDSYNTGSSKKLYPSSTAAEADSTVFGVDFLSNGFKPRTASGDFNESGRTFTFAAFASSPFGGSGVSPATAR